MAEKPLNTNINELPLKNPWALSIEETARFLDIDPDLGLNKNR